MKLLPTTERWKTGKKVAATLLSLSIVASLCYQSVMATPQSEYVDNMNQQKEYEDLLEQTQNEQATLEQERDALLAQYAQLEAAISTAKAEMDALDAEIAALELDIETTAQQVDDKLADYYARLRYMEEQGTGSYWAILFQSESLIDFLNRVELVEELMANDQAGIDTMSTSLSVLEEKNKQLSSLRADRNHAATKLKQAQRDLSAQIQTRIDTISQLTDASNFYTTELLALTERAAELRDQLAGRDYDGEQNTAYIIQRYLVETGERERNPLGADIAEFALQYLGGEYVWGGASPDTSFDCSGLVFYVYGQFGYSIMRTARPQYQYSGQHISKDALQAGDLVFFHPPEEYDISHVGMYIGDGLFLHAASRTSGIKVSSLYSTYYTENYAGAKRII